MIDKMIYLIDNRFSKAMQRKYEKHALSFLTIRNYISRNKDKAPHTVEDQRHNRAVLPVEVRDDLSQTLAQRDLSSRGCHNKGLRQMIDDVVDKELTSSQSSNAAKTVLKWGRKKGILKEGKQKSCSHNTRRCEAGTEQNQRKWHDMKNKSIDELVI